MNEKNIQQNEAVELDLRRILEALRKKSWLMMLVSVLTAVAALLFTLLFVTPQYKSSAMFYVNNNSMSLGDAAISISSADISASRNLVKSYIVILNTRESLNDVIDYAGVDLKYAELKKMISAASVDSTEIFQVTVTSPDPQQAEKLANAIAYILPKRITSIIEGTSAKIVDSAVIASRPSSPSYSRNTVIGFLAGFVLSALFIVLRVVFDITTRSEEDIAQNCKYPVLTAVPDMLAPSKGGYDYAYDRDRAKNDLLHPGRKSAVIGRDISFAAAEAYKLLRTKLQFSFADERDSRIIAVSSALSGEGKSVSSINLAYSLAQLGKKVILIDCDMRRPTLAEKLKIAKKPGLSNFLTGQCDLQEMIQIGTPQKGDSRFFAITAGENPPNPIELLSSERMSQFLDGLRDICDYVILDMPPMGEVSDALAVTRHTDGVLLVVRQDLCNRLILSDTIRQFEYVGAKILGVIYNCTTEGGSYYQSSYYKKYYRKYYRSYNREARKTEKKTPAKK